MQLYVNKRNITHRPSPLHPLRWRYARDLERLRRAGEQQLVRRVQDIIVGLGLTQVQYSVAAGYMRILPKVILVAERPVELDIHMLPGQIPDDFAAKTKQFAYGLGVAEVRVVPLGPPYLIRLILVPAGTNRAPAKAACQRADTPGMR